MTALQIGVIVFWNCRLVVSGVGGMLAIGFGGLSRTAHIPGQWLRGLLATGIALLTCLLVVDTFADLAWDARAELEPRSPSLEFRFRELSAARDAAGQIGGHAALHASNPSFNPMPSRPRPMNTTREFRGAPSGQAPMGEPSISICTPWKT